MQKYVWQAVFCLMMLVALWFSLTALYRVYVYARLNSSAPATVVAWSVEELSSDHYALHAKYTFSVQGHLYEGETTLDEEKGYRNSWAAEKAIPEHAAMTWTAWYSPSNPKYSSLQKTFPLKECLSSLVLWGILIYFIGLKYYVMRLQ